MSLPKKNILVTGANGLIGFELIQNLISKGFNVYALSHSAPNTSLPASGLLHYIHADLSKDWDVGILPAQIDIIYHLAQSEHFRDFPEKAIEVFNVNTASTLKLLNYAVKASCKKFVYASSGGIYGNSDKGFTEDTPINFSNDLGFYFSTKVNSEILASNYNKFFDVIITRFFFVYGKRQNKSMLIPRLVTNISTGTTITLNGNDGIKINPIHVSDAANALSAVVNTSGSHVFNIGGSEILSFREICTTIGALVNNEPVFKILDAEVKHLIGDISKMSQQLYLPKVSFKQGVSELID
ncbi:MAG: NAD(P)-dependent oxidoreductase [Bacteroidetes bacterium]|nr:NAD(P)-dependent oxidoreductase [Bacteroidota bacterium]